MKVGIISNQRTRSSYILDCLTKQHSLFNFGEKLFNDQVVLFRTKLFSANKENNIHWTKYKQNLPQMIDTVFEADRFAVKIFPAQLMNLKAKTDLPDAASRDNFFLDPENIILDIGQLRFDRYDTLYLLDRDITDACCSFVYASMTNQWLFFDKAKADSVRRPVTCNLSPLDYFSLDLHLISLLMIPYFESYLTENNIAYTKVMFDDIPDFVKNACPEVKSGYVDAEFDYRELMTNYAEVCDYVSKRVTSIKPRLDELFKETRK
jgi:hypothetical protein